MKQELEAIRAKALEAIGGAAKAEDLDRKSTRLNSSH